MHFQIQHLSLAVSDPLRLASEALHSTFGSFRRGMSGRETHGANCLRLHVTPGLPAQLIAAPAGVTSGKPGLPGRVAVWRSGNARRYAVPGQTILEADVATGDAALHVDARCEAAALRYVLLQLVCEAFCAPGHSFMHAACLAMPCGRAWRGVVVSAPSNTGKTTTALALVSQGWRLLGDDITLAEPAQRGGRVWGFPRACHLRPNTLRLLPWLNALELAAPDDEQTRALPLGQLGRGAWQRAPWLEPALLVVLAAPNSAATRIEPISAGQALIQFAAESLPAAAGECDAQAERDFANLSQMCRQVPACRLSVGPNFAGLAEMLEDAAAGHRSSDFRRVA